MSEIGIFFFFSEIVGKPFYDEEDLPPSDTDSEDEVVLLKSDRDWRPVNQE